jgi:hypothetical protein
MLCRLRDLGREAERDDDEGLATIGAHDQKIGAVEPRIFGEIQCRGISLRRGDQHQAAARSHIATKSSAH